MSGLIILDRDGVLNEMVIDPEHGTIDSPLHPSQVRLIDGAAEAVRDLTQAGYQLAIATNQPSAAKGKTTLENLKAAHARIVDLVEASGGKISQSYICLHRSEDQCACRKPKSLMLEQAIEEVGGGASENVWMVGDGVTDIEAGARIRLKTAFLGPRKCDMCKCFESRDLKPDAWFKNLYEFSRSLTGGA